MAAMDHYRTLGVDRDADAAIIHAVYRHLAKRHHPDAGGDPTTFRSITTAYHTLRDPAARAAYDQQIATDDTRPDPSAHAAYTRRDAGGDPVAGWGAASGDEHRPFDRPFDQPFDQPSTPWYHNTTASSRPVHSTTPVTRRRWRREGPGVRRLVRAWPALLIGGITAHLDARSFQHVVADSAVAGTFDLRRDVVAYTTTTALLALLCAAGVIGVVWRTARTLTPGRNLIGRWIEALAVAVGWAVATATLPYAVAAGGGVLMLAGSLRWVSYRSTAVA